MGILPALLIAILSRFQPRPLRAGEETSNLERILRTERPRAQRVVDAMVSLAYAFLGGLIAAALLVWAYGTADGGPAWKVAALLAGGVWATWSATSWVWNALGRTPGRLATVLSSSAAFAAITALLAWGIPR